MSADYARVKVMPPRLPAAVGRSSNFAMAHVHKPSKQAGNVLS
jgi:hypothetical protein